MASPGVAALYSLLGVVATAQLPDVAGARHAYLGAEDTEQIGREELVRRVAAGRVVVLDVRPAVEFAAGHIPGAVLIPVDELPGRLAELPTDLDVVAYYRGPYCVFAHDAVRLLAARGRRALRLADGMVEWRLAGLPVETDAV